MCEITVIRRVKNLKVVFTTASLCLAAHACGFVSNSAWAQNSAKHSGHAEGSEQAGHSSHSSHASHAQELQYPQVSRDCGEHTYFEFAQGMCMPYPSQSQGMFMLSANAYGVGSYAGGTRGGTQFSAPNMVMLDLGHTLGERQYLNLDAMFTFERWTYPDRGYLLLGQVGEEDAAGAPYIDGQHPHSSPLMGLTLSDTIALGSREGRTFLKFSFAPRGATNDGNVAFMHRPSAAFIPDAPLGHHIGQDLGHISSTVIGAELGFEADGPARIQLTAFNGREPSPSAVDLPLGVPNSAAVRLVKQVTPGFLAMGSAAYLQGTDHHGLSRAPSWRAGFSFQADQRVSPRWQLFEMGTWGWTSAHDGAPAQTSALGEVAMRLHQMGEGNAFWNVAGWNTFLRLEWVQRTANQLAVVGDSSPMSNNGVFQGSLGSSFGVSLPGFAQGYEVALGGLGSLLLLPADWGGNYGKSVLGTVRVFVQLRGTAMAHF